jgi:hypothetical protein
MIRIPGYLGGTPVEVYTLKERIVNKLRNLKCQKQENTVATKNQSP